MNVKELKEKLNEFEDNRQVVLHQWKKETSSFVGLNLSATPRANTKNLLVLIVDDLAQVVPLREKGN